MIRVKALMPYPIGRVGGQRYRMEQWAAPLRAEGIEVSFAPFLSPRGMDVLYRKGRLAAKVTHTTIGYLRRLGDFAHSERADLVYVYREATLLGPAWLERLYALRRALVFDFDDAIYLPDASAANPWTRTLKPRGKTAAVCRLARHVVVGNEVLAQFARAHARQVTVVPSTVDTDWYEVRERPANAVPVVGWTGSHTTVPHLLGLAPALRRLRRQMPFELRVIGGEVAIDGVDVRCLPWRAESEVDDLRPIDVGLMPLPDEEWSRGKCGMKALQYMGLAIPPVVSPVGANATIVSDGVDGFHAIGEEQWVDRIATLLCDAGLRRRMGAAARRVVEERYSARAQAPRLAALLREVVR